MNKKTQDLLIKIHERASKRMDVMHITPYSDDEVFVEFQVIRETQELLLTRLDELAEKLERLELKA